MLPLLAARPFAHRDRIELRPGGNTPHPLFNDSPYIGDLERSNRPLQRAFLNGKPTKVVLPGTYDLGGQVWNPAGRTAGAFFFSQGMNVHTTYATGFATSRGRLELLPFIPSAIDARGRVVGCTQAPDDPILASPTDASEMPRGVLWDHGRLFQLGPATGAWFGRSGEVRGYYEVDLAGKRVMGTPIRLTADPSLIRYRLFLWKAGRRTEGATVVDEPTPPKEP